ncbi:50S ribosomal protein L4 [bacterium]|nr:50S ribosomal protein L4 [bacterium]
MLKDILLRYLSRKDVLVLNWAPKGEKPKTAEAYKVLKKCKLQEKRLNLFVSVDDVLTLSSFANLANVSPVCFDQPNAYDLSNARKWVILEKDLGAFKEMVKQWI